MFGEDQASRGNVDSGKKPRPKQTARKSTGTKPPQPRRPRAPSKAKATAAAKKATIGAASKGKRGASNPLNSGESSGEPSEIIQMSAESLKVQEDLLQLGYTIQEAQTQLKAPELKVDDPQAAILEMLRDIRQEMKEMRDEFRYDVQEVTERLDMLVRNYADLHMDVKALRGLDLEYDFD